MLRFLQQQRIQIKDAASSTTTITIARGGGDGGSRKRLLSSRALTRPPLLLGEPPRPSSSSSSLCHRRRCLWANNRPTTRSCRGASPYSLVKHYNFSSTTADCINVTKPLVSWQEEEQQQQEEEESAVQLSSDNNDDDDYDDDRQQGNHDNNSNNNVAGKNSNNDETLTPQEKRKRLRKVWMGKMSRQTVEGVRDILHALEEKHMKDVLLRYRNMTRRQIYIPEPRIATKATTKSTGYSSRNHTSNPDDFSEWEDYLNQAERSDPLLQKHRSRHKVYRGIHRALSLLRVMKEQDWKRINNMFDDKEDAFQEFMAGEKTTDRDGMDENDWAAAETVNMDSMQSEDVLEETEESHSGDEYSFDAIQNALDAVSSGKLELSTEYFNLLLARASVALDFSNTECLDVVGNIAKVLKENQSEVAPDSITSEILIRVVSQRFGSPHTALRFVNELVKDPSLRSADSLRAAFQLCMKVNDYSLACRLWECYVSCDESEYFLPFDVVSTHLEILKSNFLQEEAAQVVQSALRLNRKPKNKEIDEMLKRVFWWPLRNRDASLENLVILERTLEILSKETTYNPSPQVWTSLVLAASKNAKHNTQRMKLAYAAMKELFERFPNYGPQNRLTEIGLDTCQRVGDPWLAINIFSRRVADTLHKLQNKEENKLIQPESNLGQESDVSESVTEAAVQADDGEYENDDHHLSRQNIRVSSEEANKVMDICVKSHSMDAILSFLTLVEEYDQVFYKSFYPEMCSVAIHSFVGHRKTDTAEEILRKLIERGYTPKEKDFGAIMRGRVVSGDLQTAEDLFDSLEKTAGSVPPGPACYHAMVLACIQKNNFEDCLSWYDRMLEVGVEPLPSTYTSLLLASFKTGGKASTVELLGKILQSEATISQETALLTIRMLLPELENEQNFADIRQRIRSMIDDEKRNPDDPLFSFMKLIRTAELEDEKFRYAKTASTASSDGWRSVLSALIDGIDSGSKRKVEEGEEIPRL